MAKKRPIAKTKIVAKSKPSSAKAVKPAGKKPVGKKPVPTIKKKPMKPAAKPAARGKKMAPKAGKKKPASKAPAAKKKTSKPAAAKTVVKPKKSVKPAVKKPAPAPKPKPKAKPPAPAVATAPQSQEEIIIISSPIVEVTEIAIPIEVISDEDLIEELAEAESAGSESAAPAVESHSGHMAPESEESMEDDFMDETDRPPHD